LVIKQKAPAVLRRGLPKKCLALFDMAVRRRVHRRKLNKEPDLLPGAVNPRDNPKAFAQLVRANADELSIFLTNSALMGSARISPRLKWKRRKKETVASEP